MAGKLTRWRWVSFGFACLVGLASVLLPVQAGANGTPGLAVSSAAAAPANLRRPEIVMVDPGAEALRPMFEQIVNEEFDLAAREFDWWPDYPITVYVATEVESSIALYREKLAGLAGMPAGRPEQVARAGRAWARTAIRDRTPQSSFMVFALHQPARRHPLFVRAAVAHEFTHFAQSALAPSTLPQWFFEGQASYRADLRLDPASTRLLRATRDLLRGQIVALGQAQTSEDWANLEGEASVFAVYARATAVVAMLVEQYGWEATVKLVQARPASREQFYERLQGLTGTDLAGLEARLNEWLTALPAFDVGDAATGNRVLGVSFDRGRGAQLELRQEQDPSCGEIPPPSDTGEYAGVYSAGFNVKFDADARFLGTRPSTSRPGVTARAGGRLVGSEIVGWYRYTNSESGCDSGPMAYGTGPVRTLDSPAPSTGLGVTYVAHGGQAGASFGLKTAADLFCGALPVAPNGSRLLEGYVVVPGPDGGFQTSGPLAEGSPATVTISGKLVGETDITGTFRFQDAQAGCDSGPVPFGTIATSEPAEPADEEGA